MPRNKYGAVKTTVDGVIFDSKLEANEWQKLVIRERLGEITNLKRQITFPLEINGHKIAKYIADFTYTENGNRVIRDAKGYKTPEFNLKAKIFKAIYGEDIILSDGLPATRRRPKRRPKRLRLP